MLSLNKIQKFYIKVNLFKQLLTISEKLYKIYSSLWQCWHLFSRVSNLSFTMFTNHLFIVSNVTVAIFCNKYTKYWAQRKSFKLEFLAFNFSYSLKNLCTLHSSYIKYVLLYDWYFFLLLSWMHLRYNIAKIIYSKWNCKPQIKLND